MTVRIDQAGEHDHLRCVDQLVGLHIDRARDLDDRSVFDQDVAGTQIAHGRVHADHDSALD